MYAGSYFILILIHCCLIICCKMWCKQRYSIDLIYPILLLAIQPFALLAVGLPAVSSRWLSVTAPHGLPLFIGGPLRSNFATAVLPAVYSRWLSAAVPLASGFRRLPVPAAPPLRLCQQHLPDSSLPQCRHPLRNGAPASNKPHLAEKISGLASNLAHLGRIC